MKLKPNNDTMLVYIAEQGSQKCQLRQDYFGLENSQKVVDIMCGIAADYCANKIEVEQLNARKNELLHQPRMPGALRSPAIWCRVTGGTGLKCKNHHFADGTEPTCP